MDLRQPDNISCFYTGNTIVGVYLARVKLPRQLSLQKSGIPLEPAPIVVTWDKFIYKWQLKQKKSLNENTNN